MWSFPLFILWCCLSICQPTCLYSNMLGALCSTSRLLMISKIRLNWLRERLGPNEDCIKMAILAPGAIFEVLPRAKISKLGQSKHYTSRTTQNDARNIKKSDLIDFGERLGRNEDCTKMAIWNRKSWIINEVIEEMLKFHYRSSFWVSVIISANF